MLEMEQDLERGGGIPLLVPLESRRSSLNDSNSSQSPNCPEGDDDDDYYNSNNCDNNVEDYRYRSSVSLSSSLPKITFRPIVPRDREMIQALHEDWFPVAYHDEFYDELVQHRMAHSGEPLYTCVATVPKINQQQADCTAAAAATTVATATTASPARRRRPDIGTLSAIIEDDREMELDHDTQQQQSELVAGCVVGCFVDATKLSGITQSLLISDRTRYKRLFYIMTWGAVPLHRQCGLGTALIEKCMEQVERDTSCGVLYLHVITSNLAAIRFYEKLGFYRVQEIANYYTIDGKLHGCYLYAKYYHGTLK
jgi:ribosomal protein S18 acetylase RimI-like enzyme